ncbi:hypothetical protein HDU98_008835 [Podochytrium sp. JEL0797]|nr:hypothetical protein HDU98_008835 [Podochytrium sp. JEL0797]
MSSSNTSHGNMLDIPEPSRTAPSSPTPPRKIGLSELDRSNSRGSILRKTPDFGSTPKIPTHPHARLKFADEGTPPKAIKTDSNDSEIAEPSLSMSRVPKIISDDGGQNGSRIPKIAEDSSDLPHGDGVVNPTVLSQLRPSLSASRRTSKVQVTLRPISEPVESSSLSPVRKIVGELKILTPTLQADANFPTPSVSQRKLQTQQAVEEETANQIRLSESVNPPGLGLPSLGYESDGYSSKKQRKSLPTYDDSFPGVDDITAQEIGFGQDAGSKRGSRFGGASILGPGSKRGSRFGGASIQTSRSSRKSRSVGGTSTIASSMHLSQDFLYKVSRRIEAIKGRIVRSKGFQFVYGCSISTRFQIYALSLTHVLDLVFITLLVNNLAGQVLPGIGWYNFAHAVFGSLGKLGLVVGFTTCQLIAKEFVAHGLVSKGKGVPLSDVAVAPTEFNPPQGRTLRYMFLGSMVLLEGAMWYLLLFIQWAPVSTDLGVFPCIPATYPVAPSFLKNVPGFLSEGHVKFTFVSDEWLMVTGGQMDQITIQGQSIVRGDPEKRYFDDVVEHIGSTSKYNNMTGWFVEVFTECVGGITYDPTQTGKISSLIQWGQDNRGRYDLNQTWQGIAGAMGSMSHYLIMQYNGSATSDCLYSGNQGSGIITIPPLVSALMLSSVLICFVAQVFQLLRWALTSGGSPKTDRVARILNSPLLIMFHMRAAVTGLIPDIRTGDHSTRSIRKHFEKIPVRLGESKKTRGEPIGTLVMGPPKDIVAMNDKRQYFGANGNLLDPFLD